MKYGRIDWAEMNRRANELLISRLNLDIEVTDLLSTYSVAIQQMIAIARALNVSAKVLILDEPTSSLDRDEVDQLFSVIRKLKVEGLSIVFISHFLDQVYEISDRITVLRNGKWIGEYRKDQLPRLQLVSKIIGKELDDLDALTSHGTKGANQKKVHLFLKAKELTKKGNIQPFNLEMYQGEIVGLAGLLGSGRTELARLLFGVDKHDGGEIEINGRKTQLKTPRHAIENGIAFCSENRKTEGIIPDLTIR